MRIDKYFILTILIIILLIISIFIPPESNTRILGLFLIIISSLKWGFKGGLFSALIASIVFLYLYLSPESSFTLVKLISTFVIYFIAGFGLGQSVRIIQVKQEKLMKKIKR
ncbi:MAG: DUF4118 domain-containing protein [Bacillota bacterium]